MSKTIVSITTRQASAPYLIFLSLYKEGDTIALITSQEMQEREGYIAENLRQHLDKNINIKSIPLPKGVEEDWLALQQILEESFAKDEEYILDLTGGTKFLAIAAYKFFKTQRNSTFVYAPINRNSYIAITESDTKSENKPFEYRLGVEEFLSVNNGFSTKFDQPYGTFKDAKTMYRIFQEKIIDKEFFEYLQDRKFRKHGIKELSEVDITVQHNIDYILSQISTKETEQENRASIDFIQYITGGWFEEYIYYLVKEHIKPDDITIGAHIKQKKNANDNELDVSFTIDNKLYVIECKTVVNKDLFTNTRYKSDSLRNTFGLNVTYYICTLSELTDDQKKKAGKMRIQTIDGKILNDFDDNICDFIDCINKNRKC